MVTSVIVMLVGCWLPFSPFASAMGFAPLPGLYWPFIVATLLSYIVLTQVIKMWLLRKMWI
jgi:Mg2+-importing ATPase